MVGKNLSDLLVFEIAFLIAIAIGALVFAVLAYFAAQNAKRATAHKLDILENGLKHNFSNNHEANRALRSELLEAVNLLSQNLGGQFTVFRGETNTAIAALLEGNEKRGKEITGALTSNLDKLREENSAKLEQMRVTVDEKLQGTLEKRLGESFKLVSDRLEAVHQGLGEMQTLATGVGDLKRVLTNVKSRGTWGEVQLEALLTDMLTPEQFDKNVRINPNSGETVEFAIRLPGKFDDKPVYIAIDSKFPIEDYERLVLAQDGGGAEDIEIAGKALEKAIKVEAKRICDKYIHVPHSTDFAIMYLPTEGLFAEVIRRPTLMQEIQTKFKIMINGPTTLAATLSSLQMGFRTLAIEKRSSEVWEILGAAKAEFARYGGVWDKLKKQLETAQNTVEEAGKRTRAIERNLRGVESTQVVTDVEDVLALTFGDSEE